MRRLIRRLVRAETVAVLVAAWLAGALGLGLATGAGAVPTVALMALGPLLGGLLLLLRHSLDLAGRIGNLAGECQRTLATVRRVESGANDIKKEIRQTFRQLEALQNLNAVLPVTDVLPATRGWAASPDLLVVVVGLAVSERQSLVVEWAAARPRCGSHGNAAVRDRRPGHRAQSQPGLRRPDPRHAGQARRPRSRRGPRRPAGELQP